MTSMDSKREARAPTRPVDHIDMGSFSIFAGYINDSLDQDSFTLDLGEPFSGTAKVIIQLFPIWSGNTPTKINGSTYELKEGENVIKIKYEVDDSKNLVQLAYTVFIKFGI